MIKKLLNILFPRTCLVCNKIIAGGNFCIEDWNKLHFLQDPACDICFQPFEFKVDDKVSCGKCMQNRPEYFKALAVLNYDENSKNLITKFKYFDQTHLAKYFAEMMLNQAREILPDVDFIAPIPLHKFRIIRRFHSHTSI